MNTQFKPIIVWQHIDFTCKPLLCSKSACVLNEKTSFCLSVDTDISDWVFAPCESHFWQVNWYPVHDFHQLIAARWILMPCLHVQVWAPFCQKSVWIINTQFRVYQACHKSSMSCPIFKILNYLVFCQSTFETVIKIIRSLEPLVLHCLHLMERMSALVVAALLAHNILTSCSEG